MMLSRNLSCDRPAALLGAALFFLLLPATAGTAAPRAPDWVRAAAAAPPGDHPARTQAVLLLDETVVDIAPDGAYRQRNRIAIRILTQDGAGNALARTGYNSSSDKLVSLQAWSVHPSGKVFVFGKKETVDVARFGTALELYGKQREARISGMANAVPGSVFAYESVTEQRSVSAQQVIGFQADLPVVLSSFTVNLPPGWSVDHRTFNHEPLQPVVNGRTSRWEMRNIPASPRESMAPSGYISGPWLALDYRRPEGARGTNMSWVYDDWRSISEQFTPHYQSAAATNEAVRKRAESLTRNAPSVWEATRALCAYAQEINYISIDLNSEAGGGFIPRPAGEVLASGYGDCKDKSTLLRSLLASRGIVSYPLVVYSGDAARVHESWPSPIQFNHCVVAISVDDSIDGPAVIEHPALGRMLVFDPTNPYAPAGVVPAEDQGGLGLIIAGSDGGLVRLPSARAGDNRIVRHIEAELTPTGGIAGKIREEFRGNPSVEIREEVRKNSPTQYREIIERWLGNTLPAVRALDVTTRDSFDEAAITLEMEFGAPAHGRLMRNQLLVFKPVLVARRGIGFLKPGERKTPVVFEGISMSESTEIRLPAGFVVDEMIEPVDIESPFGRYSASARVDEAGRLVFERNYTLFPSVVPASDYQKVRDFFERIVQTEQSPVVLARE